MKRFITILLAMMLLTACGDKAASASKGPSSGGGLVVSQPGDRPADPDPDPNTDQDGADAETPIEEGDTSQADVALIREIIFTYGAEEDTLNQPGVIVTKKRSFFYRTESWSGENGLTASDYLSWEDTLPTTGEEQADIDAGQSYAEGRSIGGFSSRYIGSGEMVERKISAHFEVTPEHLRSDPEYYDDSIPGYFLPFGGGGMGVRPTVSFTYKQDGDILTIPVILTFPDGSEPETVHTLTVRLEADGGWKYLGCQVT